MAKLYSFSLRKIQYFIEVVECGSIIGAAKKLYITQPLLSKSIRELETETGVRLFTHSGKKLILTEAGKYLYKEWKSALSQIHVSVSNALLMQNHQDHIRIGSEYMFLMSLKNIWISRIMIFQNQYPWYTLSTTYGNLGDIINQLLDGHTNFAICTIFDIENYHSELQHLTLASLPVYLYTGESHPFHQLRKKVLSWSDFKNEKFMTIDPHIATWLEKLLRRYANEAGFTPQIVKYTETQM